MRWKPSSWIGGKHGILAASVVLGGLFWVVDAIVDDTFFYEDSFANVMLRVPGIEIYMRSLVLALFVVFGIVADALRESKQLQTLL